VTILQVVCVAGMNDSHVAARESVLMGVLLMIGKYAHRDPPSCKRIPSTRANSDFTRSIAA
jgi:hypothetical protein